VSPGRTTQVVLTSDDVRLHVEVDEPEDPAVASGLTLVLAHGYTLDSRSWTFQRRTLSEAGHRVVLWDQRGHGRSASGDPAQHTISRLGEDLGDLLAAVVPSGPVALVGHSMGAMAIMSYAGRRGEQLGERLHAVALVSTSAGGLDAVRWGLGQRVGSLVNEVGPIAAAQLAQHPRMFRAVRRHPTAILRAVLAASAFGSRVPASVRRLTSDMILGTDPAVMASFAPTLRTHDTYAALTSLSGVPVLVLVGDRDLLTPLAHSARIAQALPHAEHVVVQGGGHILMLEHPECVSERLAMLADRCLSSAPAAGWGEHAPRHTVIDLRPGRGHAALSLGVLS